MRTNRGKRQIGTWHCIIRTDPSRMGMKQALCRAHAVTDADYPFYRKIKIRANADSLKMLPLTVGTEPY